jgi:hypothetical protein
MEASSMLDVLHYFFEEDNNFVSQEHAVITERRRVRLYQHMYGKDYPYVIMESDKSNLTEDDQLAKPYLEPTEFDPDSFNPFGNLLDAPMS